MILQSRQVRYMDLIYKTCIAENTLFENRTDHIIEMIFLKGQNNVLKIWEGTIFLMSFPLHIAKQSLLDMDLQRRKRRERRFLHTRRIVLGW